MLGRPRCSCTCCNSPPEGGTRRATCDKSGDAQTSRTVSMIDSQTARSRFQPNTRLLIGGAVLIGAGGLLGLAGAALAGSALIAAVRRRVKQMDVPPGELARRKW